MKNKKIIFLVILITIMISIVYLLCGEKYNLNTYKIGLNTIVEDIFEGNFENYNENKIEEVKKEVDEVLNNTENDVNMAECYFILGMMNIKNKDNKNAILNFNKATMHFKGMENNNLPIQMKTYYELSNLYLQEDELAKSQKIFNNIINKGDSKEINEYKIEYSLRRVKDLYLREGFKELALELLEKTVKLASKTNYTKLEDVYTIQSEIYVKEHRIAESINAKLKLLEICNEKNLKNKFIKVSVDIGCDYIYLNEFEEAILYLSEGISEKNSEFIRCKALLNIAQCYIKIENYKEANKSLEDLLNILNETKNTNLKEEFLSGYYIVKADLKIEENNPLQGIELISLSKEKYNEDVDDNFYNFDLKIYEEFGDAYYKLGKYKEALNYHKKAESLIKESDNISLLEIYNEKVCNDYKALKDNKNTILYLEKNIELKSKKGYEIKKQYLQYINNKFRNEKNLQTINTLEAKNRHVIYLFIMMTVITLVLSIFMYYIYNQNREISRLNKLFKNLSLTDSLTNLNNRRALDEFLVKNKYLFNDIKLPVSFIMIDIDYFKLYNDNYGHLAGDKVLELISKILKITCRKTDFIARYGGEEFIIIMLNSNKFDAINLVQRIKKNIYNANITHKYSKVSDRITLSIGIATSNENIKSYQEYIKKADDALYKAKSKGRNTYICLP